MGGMQPLEAADVWWSKWFVIGLLVVAAGLFGLAVWISGG